MSSGGYILLPEADDDVVESAAYLIENASEEVAARFTRSIFSTASLLATMPGIGLHCHFKSPQFDAVRRIGPKGFEHWLVFYRPRPGGIEVLRVIHSSRNWPRLFR